jgi:hypothetical protein
MPYTDTRCRLPVDLVLHRTEQVVTNLKVPTGIRNTDFFALMRVILCLLDFTDTYCSVVSGKIIKADTSFTLRKVLVSP